jgi:hypothetical protein
MTCDDQINRFVTTRIKVRYVMYNYYPEPMPCDEPSFWHTDRPITSVDIPSHSINWRN